MANPQSTATMQRSAKVAPQTNSMAIIAPLAGWLLPGLGHFIQRRWIRGLLLMVAILTMFFTGLAMQGKVYSFNTGDLLDILGFIGDIGVGALYFVARMMDWGIGNIHRAVADYGTKYIVVAGLLNIIAAVDAHHIAIGKKP
jgi:peptidoglycan/LPS O-acetylase OafA/YrhL